MDAIAIDALVVGAGPVGLTMGHELARRGLSCRVVDMAEAPTLHSKAQIIHARTQEILEDIDPSVIEALLLRGKPLRGVNVFAAGESKRVAHVTMSELDAPYPFPLSIPQRDTETILEAALRRRGVSVDRKVRLDRFTQDAAGVVATLVHDGGREEEVLASYILGCDGAHSTVRRISGMELEGSTYAFRLIQADVHVVLPFEVADDEIAVFLHPEGALGLLPLPGERRYRMLVVLGAEEEVEPTLETFQAIMRARGPAGAVVDDPAWTVAFRIHARLCPKLRDRRAFLAGDAAHIHSPAGGQGMNMGMQDAYNLGWKLALVQRGVGRPSLLDSYAAERHPVHRATLESTDFATRRGDAIVRLKNKLAVGLRNQLVSFVSSLGFVQSSLARGISMLDVGYDASPIVAESRARLLESDVLADRSTEAPSLVDWIRFGDGPAPGRRAVDALLEPGSLFELFAGTHHTLLLFDGAASTDAGYQTLARIAAAVRQRCGVHVRTYVVLPREARPPSLPVDIDVVFDRSGAAHKRYGARSECLYLVRPDKHVGFRSQPADRAALLGHLDTIFSGGGVG